MNGPRGHRMLAGPFRLARTENRTAEQESRLTEFKAELAQRVIATPAAGVFDIADE